MGSPSGDLLSAFPMWVQIAASLGMFVAAVGVSAWSFAKRLNGKWDVTPTPPEDTAALLSAHNRIAQALEQLIALATEYLNERKIEQEVELRLKEHHPKE